MYFDFKIMIATIMSLNICNLANLKRIFTFLVKKNEGKNWNLEIGKIELYIENNKEHIWSWKNP